ncbi:MAG: PQQ-dependent sugar dehydrogenase [Vicinamibacteraceae bacterium]
MRQTIVAANMSWKGIASGALLLAGLASMPSLSAAPPTGFTQQDVARPDGGAWNQVVGLTFSTHGRMFAWERAGRVWIVDEGHAPVTTPFLDISDEVGGWRDFGLLGLALHPNFDENGYIYVMYVVDRHHLLHCGEPAARVGRPVCDDGYNSATNEYFDAAIGRITRYTALMPAGESDFSQATTVDEDTRKVLLGETITTGIPILHQSHGTGTLLFGEDGTLLASTGDGASYSSVDTGNARETYYAQAVADGIITPKENIGAYRSQLLDSLNGKLLRLDPATGDAVSSNPFYDAAGPRAARSRVWALGLRNPFRMTLKPNTGAHDPAEGHPGTIYLGDVGFETWEDHHVSKRGGENFGWPAFEGMTEHGEYWNRNTPNMDAPNPLFDGAGCTQEYFYFRDLIVQDTRAPLSFPNPCNAAEPITTANVFVHTRPIIDSHHSRDNARWATYNGDVAEHPQIGQSNTEGTWTVEGTPFRGNAAVAGVWYTADDFPSEYHNTYFAADYGGGWIRNIVLDSNDMPQEVRPFDASPGPVVAMATHPIEGSLYYVVWPATVRKVAYTPSNSLPVAVIDADITYGPGPLTVQFVGDGSSDPDQDPLTYAWDFGDGTVSNVANPQHTFSPETPEPTGYVVTLTVTDADGAINRAQLAVSVNNTPPSLTITSPIDGTTYPITGDAVFDLTASISDAEHSADQLSCAWQTVLHHNDHAHPEPADSSCSTTTVISPLGCGDETYFYRVHLTVTDAAGLSTAASSTLLPDCGEAWQGQDIGDVETAGSFEEEADSITVHGSGDNILGWSDEFYHVYQTLEGDGEIIARLTSLTQTHEWAKAGVMVRATLSDDSSHGMMAVTADHGVAAYYRMNEGDFGLLARPGPELPLPVWLRLVRSGDTLTGYYSSDGTNWTLGESGTISLPDSVLIGLALTSRDDGALATATFDNVSVTRED